MGSKNRIVHHAMIITLVLLICLIHITPVEATEPSDIDLVYDFNSTILTVNVSHYVANTKTHYIENIEIKNNDFSTLNRTYSNQTYNWGEYDSFTVSTSVGDNLTVITTCKRGHSLTRWLIVSSTTTINTPTETTSTTAPSNPTDGSESQGTTPDLGFVTVVVIGVILSLVIFFAWLNPEYVPDIFKRTGSQIMDGLSLFWEKIRRTISNIKTKETSK